MADLSLPSAGAHTAPTSFCKCTCFTNSTIIPLDAPRSNPPRSKGFLLPRNPPPSSPELFARDPEDDGDEKKEEGGAGNGGKEKEEDRKEFRAGNCNDCNRQYCIDAHLPICHDAGAEDVVATCFRMSHLIFFPPPPPRPSSHSSWINYHLPYLLGGRRVDPYVHVTLPSSIMKEE